MAEPDLDTVVATIDRLRGIDLKNATPEQLWKLCAQFNETTTVETFLHHYDSWWRCRILRDKKRFDNVSEMKQPPPENARMSRCNLAGKPIFYASNSSGAACSEAQVETGEVIQLIEVKVRKDVGPVSAFVIGEIEHVFKSGKSLIYDEPTRKGVRAALDELNASPKKLMATVLIDAFFADRFRQPAAKEHDYKLTSVFIDRLLSAPFEGKPSRYEGVVYPSVEHVAGLNIAIRPEVSDAKLEVVQSAVAEATVLPYGVYDLHWLARTRQVTADGKFVW